MEYEYNNNTADAISINDRATKYEPFPSKITIENANNLLFSSFNAYNLFFLNFIMKYIENIPKKTRKNNKVNA